MAAFKPIGPPEKSGTIGFLFAPDFKENGFQLKGGELHGDLSRSTRTVSD